MKILIENKNLQGNYYQLEKKKNFIINLQILILFKSKIIKKTNKKYN